VMKILRDEQNRNLPKDGDFTILTDSMDVALCLLLFADIHCIMG
jgi:uncharacterized protein YhfF